MLRRARLGTILWPITPWHSFKAAGDSSCVTLCQSAAFLDGLSRKAEKFHQWRSIPLRPRILWGLLCLHPQTWFLAGGLPRSVAAVIVAVPPSNYEQSQPQDGHMPCTVSHLGVPSLWGGEPLGCLKAMLGTYCMSIVECFVIGGRFQTLGM